MRLYRKNTLTGVTRATFRFILENRTKYAIFLAITFFLYMALEVVFGEFQVLSAMGSYAGFDYIRLMFSTVFYSVLTAVVAAPLHNQIINDSKSYYCPYLGRIFIFSSLEFLLSAAVGVGTLLPVNLLVGSYWPLIMAAALFVVAAFIGIIFTTVLPYVAITPVKNLQLFKAARLSSGFRLVIFAKLFRVAFSLGIIVIGGRRILDSLSLSLPSDDTIIGYYAPLAAENIISSTGLLIFVTMASIIYVRLSNLNEDLSRSVSE